MKKSIVGVAVIFGLIAGSCTKNDGSFQNLNLKQSLENNVNKVNTALNKISQSTGYQLLSVNDGVLKSADSFTDSITLKLIAGIYTFQPDVHHFGHYFPFRLFKKTGTSDLMIVNLPQKMIFHPRYLHNYMTADSALKNDFKITATNYHFYYSHWNQFDYKISAGLKLDTADLGTLDVANSANLTSGNSWLSKYTFTGGYNISVSGQTGDTTIKTFALSKGTEVLLKETVSFVRDGFKTTERQYVLSIGNVDIKRSTGIDSIQVYMNGVLQKKAGAKITESSDNEHSICYSRDILLTFDDGTTANLSTLIKPARTTLKTLVSSMHSMYFAKNIVDYIAMRIYDDTH
jgi:hypothetical protein